MIPDRRAEISPHRHPFTRLALATFIAVGSSTYVPLLEKLASGLQITPVGEAFTPNCRTGLGVTVDNDAFLKGARVIVVEDSNGKRIADGRLKVGEEVRVEFTGPSNTVKAGRDARQFVYFDTDTDGRRVSPKKRTTVTCGAFEHLTSVVEDEPEKRETPTPSRTATPTPGSTPSPSATSTLPDTRDARIATLEAQVAQQRRIDATATRVAEDAKLAETERATGAATGAANARATITAEAQATAVIREAENRGRASYIATVTAQAGAITPTVAARDGGVSPAGTSPIDNIPGWLLGGVGAVALLVGSIWGWASWRRHHHVAAGPAHVAVAAAGPAPAAGGGAPGPGGGPAAGGP